jgi:hypothetical protein
MPKLLKTAQSGKPYTRDEILFEWKTEQKPSSFWKSSFTTSYLVVLGTFRDKVCNFWANRWGVMIFFLNSAKSEKLQQTKKTISNLFPYKLFWLRFSLLLKLPYIHKLYTWKRLLDVMLKFPSLMGSSIFQYR